MARRSVGTWLRNSACALMGGLVVAGCGAGDVELNGKIFDALGVSSATAKKAAEPNLASRSGIVVPPNTGSLPEPGSGRSVDSEADLAFINDPDRAKTMQKADLARQQEAFCKEHYEIPKSRGDATVDGVKGPAGPCRATFMSSMKIWNSDDSGEDAE